MSYECRCDRCRGLDEDPSYADEAEEDLSLEDLSREVIAERACPQCQGQLQTKNLQHCEVIDDQLLTHVTCDHCTEIDEDYFVEILSPMPEQWGSSEPDYDDRY